MVNEIRVLSVDEVNRYLEYNRQAAIKTAIGIILCILSPVLLVVLSVLTNESFLLVSPTLASIIGLSMLFLMVIIGVVLFMSLYFSKDKYDYIFEQNFKLDDNVINMVKSKINKSKNKYNCLILIGVILCIISPVPLIITSFFDNIYLILISLILLFLMVSVAVYFFVYTSTITKSYKKFTKLG